MADAPAEIEAKVLDIISEKAKIDRERLVLDAKLTDLDIASLDVVEIIFALEEVFDIQIPYNANSADSEFGTIGDVVSAVTGLVEGKA